MNLSSAVFNKNFTKTQNNLLVILLIVVIFAFISTIHPVLATVSVNWQSGKSGLSTGDGTENSNVPRVWFRITDSSLAGNNIQDRISVLVNSTSDKSGITLTLPELSGDAGIFENTNLIFTNGESQFKIDQTPFITLNSSLININSTAIDTIPNAIVPGGIVVYSTSDESGIPINLTETGPNTGIFTGPLKFTSESSVPYSSLQVKNGDIVSIFFTDFGEFQNWLIIPNPDSSTGSLPAIFGDNVTVIYKGENDTTWINGLNGPGGGGGGFIRPGLVLDVLASIGGSPYIVSPPSFGGGYYHYSDGLALVQGDNKTTFDISQYNQEIPKQILISGDEVNMTFKTYENYNPEGVVHMGLYFIPRGADDMLTTNSIASIVYDKNSLVEVNDPDHLLAHSSASSTSDGKFQYTQFSFTPTKSYDKMSFLVRAWNDHMYSTDTRIYDAVEIPEPIRTLPAGVVLYTSFNELEATLEKQGFYKPSMMAHIHDTDAVFSGSGSGTVYWLYDTINHTVTMMISDTNDNELASAKTTLQPYKIEQKGDYKFMYFTEDQLNRWDEDQEQRTMGIESAKAMFMAAEHGLLGHRNW